MSKKNNRDYSEMNRIMKSLGCDGEDGLYSCEGLNVDFDLTATADDEILLDIGHKMADMGYEFARAAIRVALELK